MSEARAGGRAYSGVPEVQPQFARPAFQNIPLNPREFGAGIGEAEEKLGRGAQQASNIFGQVAADDQVNKTIQGLDTLTTRMQALKGKDALDQGPAIRQQGQDLVNSARENLGNLNMVSEYDRQVRYIYSHFDRQIGEHLDQQQQIWAIGVNKDAANIAINGLANAARRGDQAAVQQFTGDLMRARTREAHTIYGMGDLDPAIAQEVIRSSNADATKAQVMALLPTDPEAAKALVDNNSQYFNPLEYRSLADLTNREAEKAQDAAIVRGITGGGRGGRGPEMATGPALATISRYENPGHDPNLGYGGVDLSKAPLDETGFPQWSGKEGPAGISHAAGLYQIEPGTWRRYAPKVGVKDFSPESQAKVAQAIYDAEGWEPWARYNPRMAAAIGYAKVAENAAPPSAEPIPTAGAPAAPAASPMQTHPPGFPTMEDWINKIPEGVSDEQYNRIAAQLSRAHNHMMQATSAERSMLLHQYEGGRQMLEDGRDFHYDEDAFYRLFQKDVADKMVNDLQDSRAIGQQITALHGKPISEALQIQARNHAVLANSTGEDYLRQRRLSNAYDVAIDKHIKALGSDPAGYIASTNPEVERARQMISQQTPELMARGQDNPSEAYAVKILGEEDRLQVPSDGRHVLDNLYASQLAHQIATNPDQAPQKLKALQEQWGAAWPEVWHDLVTLGNLPAAYQMVGAIENQGDGMLLATALGQANKEGANKSIEKLIDKDTTGTNRPSQQIANNVESAQQVKDYVQSMLASGASPQQVEGIVSSISLLAQTKVLYSGSDAGKAADDAVASAIGKWDFLPNGGARIPRANADAITENAEAAVDRLTLKDLQHPAIYDAPHQSPGAATAADWLRVLKASPNWITVGDSIRLLDNGGRFVRQANGAFVEVPFNVNALPKAQMGVAPSTPGENIPVPTNPAMGPEGEIPRPAGAVAPFAPPARTAPPGWAGTTTVAPGKVPGMEEQ